MATAGALDPTIKFKDLSLETWQQTDKADILLPASSAIVVLGDLLLAATASDFKLAKPDNSSFEYIKDGNSFRATVIQVISVCQYALRESYKGMETIRVSCRSLLNVSSAILGLLRKIDAGDSDKKVTDALSKLLDNISKQVGTAVHASHTIETSFDGLLHLAMELRETLVAAQGRATDRAKALALKTAVLNARKAGAEENAERTAAHFKKTQDAYKKSRERFDRYEKEVPTAAEVIGNNMLHAWVDALTLNGALLMTIYGRNPMGLVDTWDMAKKTFQETDDIELPEIRKRDAHQKIPTSGGLTLVVKLHCTALVKIATSGADGGVDWDMVNDSLPTVQSTITVDLDLLSPDGADNSAEGPNTGFGAGKTADPIAGMVPTTTTTTGGGTMSDTTMTTSATAALHPSTPLSEDDAEKKETKRLDEIRSILQGAIKVCQTLSSLKVTKPPAAVKAVFEDILDLNERSTALASAAALDARSRLPPNPPEDTTPKKPGKKSFKLAGTLGLQQALFKLRVANAQLEADRAIYVDATQTMFEAKERLGNLLSHLAGLDVRSRTAEEMLKSMVMPITVMGELQIAFTSIHTIFQSVDNLVKVTMNGPFEAFRSTTSTNTSYLNTWSKNVIVSQVRYAAQVACMVYDLAGLYTTMFDASVQPGLTMVLGMQNLMGMNASTDQAAIQEAKTKLVKWGEESLEKMSEILAQERDRLLASMDEQVKEIASVPQGFTLPGVIVVSKEQLVSTARDEITKHAARSASIMSLT